MFEFTETDKAIEVAKKWMLEHPDFEPKFEKVFNVLLASDVETKNMTQQVIKEGDINTQSPAFSFNEYVIGVIEHKKAMLEA